MSNIVNISPNGAILLGGLVTCDGFVYGLPYRIQTHIHDDHMDQFESSKGYQDIIMSEGTKALLIAEYNADIPYRCNIYAVPFGTIYHTDNVDIELLSNGHMLGSSQVAVTLQGGLRVGYSGDFDWPLDKVINVEHLVVDSTYGSPNSKRNYKMEEAYEAFIQLVLDKIKHGPITLKAFRGTLHRALELLADINPCPVIASKKLIKDAQVYEFYGYNICNLLDIDSTVGKNALNGGRFIRVYGKGDKYPADPVNNIVISLSAYMADKEDPVLEISERAYRIAITSHADFEGTLEYVKATGATEVITDNSRGGHAVELANELQAKLGITARPSHQIASRQWGV